MSSYFQDSVTDQIDTATLMDQIQQDQQGQQSQTVQNGGAANTYGLMRGGSGRLFAIDDPDIYFDDAGRPVVGNLISPMNRFSAEESGTAVMSGGGSRKGGSKKSASKSNQIRMLHEHSMNGGGAAFSVTSAIE